MPREIKVTCDHCGKDITASQNCDDFRIVVCSERLPTRFPDLPVTDMYIENPVPKNLYFCGWGCLTAKFSRDKDGNK